MPGDMAMSLAQEQSCLLRAAALLCLGRWRGQDIPELCCGRSKRGTVPVAGSVLPPAVHFTPERPFLNVLSLAPVRCVLKMMPEVMPKVILTGREGGLTGLQFPKPSFFPFLKMGTMLSLFQSVGTCPDCHDFSNTMDSG